jgi:ArsR family transcriptional regulator
MAPREIELSRPTAVACCADIEAPSLTNDEAEGTARLFKALADPNRVRLMNLIATSPESASVCDLAEAIGVSQPTVSHHLRKLLEAGLLVREHRGAYVYYDVDRQALRRAGEVLRVDEEVPA